MVSGVLLRSASPSFPVSSEIRAPRRFDLSGIGPLLGAVLAVAGASGFLSTILESSTLAAAFFSPSRHAALVESLGGRMGRDGDASLPLLVAPSLVALFAAGYILLSAWFNPGGGRFMAERFTQAAGRVAWALLPAALWFVLDLTASLTGAQRLLSLLAEGADLTAATCLALAVLRLIPWGCRCLTVLQQPGEPGSSRGPRVTLMVGVAIYIAVFTALNFGLWFNLRVPHGDSAMYEEHLWNLEHGKGFRSYLDQGLFLGEHIQVIHVLLAPLHLLFPSHLTLEFAQSVILALGAWPVFRMARRHSGSEWAAAFLGLAYLAYFPLQYLDIAIDLKTFRPSSLGIPTLLAALDALEQRRYRAGAIWLAVTLSAQEDFAIPIALIGLWLVLANRPLWPVDAVGRRRTAWGIGLFVFGVLYLWLALNVVIPWFRGGATVHTASYFSKFGQTPREIIITLLTQPGLVLGTLLNSQALLYALRLLLPLGFLPLRSPGRLLVGVPLFLLLCMNDLAMETPAPVHHFHAPLIPILFWAAAAALSTTRRSPPVP